MNNKKLKGKARGKAPVKKPLGPLSLRNMSTLKLVPRMIAERLVLKWSSWNPQPNSDQTQNDLMSEALPICQNVGEYLERARTYDVEFGVPPPVQSTALNAALLAHDSPKVVTMAIQIKNFYDAHGQSVAKKQFDESILIEKQSDLSNKFLEIVANIIYNSHEIEGDIIQFFGDQIVACLPGEVRGTEDDFGNTLANLSHAVMTAQKIHYFVSEAIDEFEEEKDKDKDNMLREIQIGLGYGESMIYHVGGVFKRTLYFASGESMTQAQDSLSLARLHRGIIVSKHLWEALDVAGLELDFVEDFQAHKVNSEGYVKIISDSPADADNFEEQRHQQKRSRSQNKYYNLLRREIDKMNLQQKDKLWQEMQKYIPKSLRPYLEFQAKDVDHLSLWKGSIKQGNHHRILTIMALTIELDGAFDSEDALYVLQTTIEIVQKQIYKMQGSLQKIYYDSGRPEVSGGSAGGLQIIAEWGQHEVNNYDNPARACLAAMNIQKAVKDFILLTSSQPDLSSVASEDGGTSKWERGTNKTSLIRKASLYNTTTNNFDTVTEPGTAFELPIHIGIATGQVFQAIVGDDSAKSQRLEVGMIGEAYTRAKTLLRIAQQEFGKVYIDQQTMAQTRPTMDAKYVRHVEFSSQFFNMPIFEPQLVDELDQFSTLKQLNIKRGFRQWENDFIKQGSLIRIHHNPMVIDFKGSYQMLNNKIYGRAQQVKNIIKHVVKRMRNQDTSMQSTKQQAHTSIGSAKPYTIVIRGDKGQGKSLFSRNILINLKQFEILVGQQVKAFHKMKSQKGVTPEKINNSNSMYDFQTTSSVNLKFRFCVSQCTPETSLQFMGIWRPIMRTLLNHVANILDKKPRKVLYQMIESHSLIAGNKLQFFQDYFNVDDMDPELLQTMEQNHTQVGPKKTTRFYEAKRFQPEFEAEVLTFLREFVLDSLDRIRNWQTEMQERGVHLSTVLVFILDNVSTMNEVDWQFYYELIQEAQPSFLNLVIILNIDRDRGFIRPLREPPLSSLGIVIHADARNYYEEVIKPRELELFDQVVDLRPLTEECINQMLLDQSEIYSKQMLDEIDKLIKIQPNKMGEVGLTKSFMDQMLDRSDQELVKTYDNQELLRSQLCWKYQVQAQFRCIEPEVVAHVAVASQGNPLVALSYFHALLTTGFLEVSQAAVVMTKKLRSTLQFNNFSAHFPQPFEILNQRSVFFDEKLQNISRGAESPLVVVACLHTLRVAALIGQKFSTQVLTGSGLCPPSFFPSQLSQLSLLRVLDVLEDNDFIEMIDEQQGERCYRFNHAFLTSTLSHMVPFRGYKRAIHSALAEFHKASSFHSRDSGLKHLLRQLLLQNEVLYPERLNTEHQKSILRKEITLRLSSLQQAAVGGENQGRERGREIVVQVARISAAGGAFDEHAAYKTRNQKLTKKQKNQKTKNKNVPIQTIYHQDIEMSLGASVVAKTSQESYELVLWQVGEEVVEAMEGEEHNEAGEAEELDAEGRQKVRETRELVIAIDIEAIGAITEGSAANERSAVHSGAAEQESRRTPKPSPKKPGRGRKGRPEEPEDQPDSQRDAANAVAFVLHLNFHHQQVQEENELPMSREIGRPDRISLKFPTENERLKWHTYLNFLKEKLQLKYFVERFSGLTLGQTASRPISHNPQPQLPPQMRFGQALRNATLASSTEPGPSRKTTSWGLHSQPTVAGDAAGSAEQLQIRQGRTGHSLKPVSPTAAAVAAEQERAARRRIDLLKEQLKLMYGVGLAHFAQHLPTPALKDPDTGEPEVSQLADVHPATNYIVEQALSALGVNLVNKIVDIPGVDGEEEREESAEATSALQTEEDASQQPSEDVEDKENEESEEEEDTEDFLPGENESQSGRASAHRGSSQALESNEEIDQEHRDRSDGQPASSGQSRGSRQDQGYRSHPGTEDQLDAEHAGYIDNKQDQPEAGRRGRNRQYALGTYNPAQEFANNQRQYGAQAGHQLDINQESGAFNNQKRPGGMHGVQPDHPQTNLNTFGSHPRYGGADLLMRNFENQQNIIYEESKANFRQIALPFNPGSTQNAFTEGQVVYKFNYDRNAIQHQIPAEEEGDKGPRTADDYGNEESERENIHSDNGSPQRYRIQCQHAKRVFSADEIDHFELRRRNETGAVKFSIQQMLGQNEDSPTQENDAETELQNEMQHLLAAAITKILDQKSIRESVGNLPRLVVEELEQQIRERHSSSSDQQKEGRSLKVQASEKLIETLKSNDGESQKSLLSHSLSRNLSKKGFGVVSDRGLRSQALLQNFIEQNLQGREVHNNAQGDDSMERRASVMATQGRGSNPNSRSEKGQAGGTPGEAADRNKHNDSKIVEQMKQLTMLLGTSESRSSLRLPIQTHTMLTLEQSIEDIKNRELYNGAAGAYDGYDGAVARSHTGDFDKIQPRRSAFKAYEQRAGGNYEGSILPDDKIAGKKGNTAHLVYEDASKNYPANHLGNKSRYNNMASMISQRSVLLSQYSAPIPEQDDDSERDDDDEEVILSRNESLLPYQDAPGGSAKERPGQMANETLGSASDKRSQLPSIQSLVDKKEQQRREELLEQTFQRDQLAAEDFDGSPRLRGDHIRTPWDFKRQDLNKRDDLDLEQEDQRIKHTRQASYLEKDYNVENQSKTQTRLDPSKAPPKLSTLVVTKELEDESLLVDGQARTQREIQKDPALPGQSTASIGNGDNNRLEQQTSESHSSIGSLSKAVMRKRKKQQQRQDDQDSSAKEGIDSQAWHTGPTSLAVFSLKVARNSDQQLVNFGSSAYQTREQVPSKLDGAAISEQQAELLPDQTHAGQISDQDDQMSTSSLSKMAARKLAKVTSKQNKPQSPESPIQ